MEAKLKLIVVPLALDIADLPGVLPLQAVQKLLHAVFCRLLIKLMRNGNLNGNHVFTKSAKDRCACEVPGAKRWTAMKRCAGAGPIAWLWHARVSERRASARIKRDQFGRAFATVTSIITPIRD